VKFGCNFGSFLKALSEAKSKIDENTWKFIEKAFEACIYCKT
jgi:hypothetical protein